ncbi:hypothetical protein PIB30_025776 [Stylosanthes scabra]|uniref:PPC domain-containing protein n=1 Tax=Stylosanthes scabra TaxID=79078 RepID=A0ABU6SAB3_9FABA|nr:hypothetical protein [Stylosanthes scabra]
MADNDINPIVLSQIPEAFESESLGHYSQVSFVTLHSDYANSTSKSDVNQTANKRKSSSEVERYILVPHVNTNNIDDLLPRSKKARGRPHGLTNKPMPPIFIRGVNEHGMCPILIEMIPRVDVIEALINFAACRRIGISIISACGPISGATIHNTLPLNTNPVDLRMIGPFRMMSLSGTYYDGLVHPGCSSFLILLGGTNGQVFSGIVARKVVAAGTVMVMATSFEKPELHRMQLDPNRENTNNNVNINGNDNVVKLFTYETGNPSIVNRRTVVTKLVPLNVGNHSDGGSGSADVDATNVKNEQVLIDDNYQV